MPTPVTIRLVSDPDDPAIARFGRLQERTYAEPENLIPASMLPRMISGGGRGRNFLLVAERGEVPDGEVLGGAVFHYFPGPNSGFSSFLAVAAEARGQGLARRLHEARFHALDEAARQPVRGVFIDVVAPERMTTHELEREQAVGSDPLTRRRVFQRLGFRRVAVPYEQPVGGPGGGPITNMDLLFCPREPAESVETELVTQTLHDYWSPWLGRAAADRHTGALRGRAGADRIPLVAADKPA